VLIVHTTESASYPWHTVVGSWSGEQRMLPRDASGAPPLGMRGWITDSAATALLKPAGLDMAKLRKDAESRDFRPVSTGITIDFSARNSVKHLSSANVVGIVRGHDSKLKNEYVALSAHWDHLGIGVPVDGDSIYNGAVDNGSGVASGLAIARAAAKMPSTRRSLIFLFVTAEESGLLGSQFYGEHTTGGLPQHLRGDHVPDRGVRVRRPPDQGRVWRRHPQHRQGPDDRARRARARTEHVPDAARLRRPQPHAGAVAVTLLRAGPRPRLGLR